MILTVVIAMPMPLWQGLAHRRMLKLAELFLCRVQLRMGLALAIAIVRLPAHLCKHFSAHCGKKQNLQCSLKICDISRKWCRPQSQCKLFHHCFTKTEHPGRTVLIGNVSLMLCLYMYLYKIIKLEGWNTPLSKWKWPSNTKINERKVAQAIRGMYVQQHLNKTSPNNA